MKKQRLSILLLNLLAMNLLVLSAAENGDLFPLKEDRTAHFSPGDISLLEQEGKLFREFTHKEGLRYYPGTELPEALSQIRTSMGRSFGVEGLFFLPLETMPQVSQNRDEFLLEVYNLTRQVSTLKGVEYYSNTKKRQRVLFEEFYRILEPGSRIPLTDSLVETIPLTDTILIYQKDASFGEAEYEVRYTFTDPEISLTMKNLTPISMGFITIAGKEELFLHMEVFPVRDGFFFYGTCIVEGRGTFVGKAANESLYQRLNSLYTWFSSKVRIFQTF